MKIGSQSNPAELVNGTFEGGLDYKTDRDGDTLKVKLSAPPGDWWTFPWMLGQYQRQWSLGLNNQVPLKLRLEAGAAESNLDLSGLRLTELKLEIGASSTNVTLPAQAGFTKAKVSAGAASTTLRIPSGVAARIRFEGGAASFEVDSARFPRVNGYRQSPDYETAANKVDLDIEGGAGSFVVR